MRSDDNTTEAFDVNGQSCPLLRIDPKQATDLPVGDGLEADSIEPGSMRAIRGCAGRTDIAERLSYSERGGTLQVGRYHWGWCSYHGTIEGR